MKRVTLTDYSFGKCDAKLFGGFEWKFNQRTQWNLFFQ
jgi:hypothetical protein